MKGLFIPGITAEMFRNGCLESIEALMAEGEIYDIEFSSWIPVSERLPEKYGEYLITWTTPYFKQSFIGICEGEVTSEYDFKHCRFKFEWLFPDYIKAYPNVEVIAWKPLPEPYNPQESEG